jgi:hypothetical protein
MRGLSVFRIRNKLILIVVALVTSVGSADVIDGEELLDPTRPFQLSANSADDSLELDLFRTVVPGSYELSFIRAGGELPLAVINQQQLTIGDVIGGAEVIAIDRSGVTLRVNNEEQRISLYGVSVKSNVVSQELGGADFVQ